MELPDTTNPWGVKGLSLTELIDNYQELPEDLVDLAKLALILMTKEGEQ